MTDAELQQHASLCDRFETLEDAARYALKWLDERGDRRAGDHEAAKRLRAALAPPPANGPPEPMT